MFNRRIISVVSASALLTTAGLLGTGTANASTSGPDQTAPVQGGLTGLAQADLTGLGMMRQGLVVGPMQLAPGGQSQAPAQQAPAQQAPAQQDSTQQNPGQQGRSQQDPAQQGQSQQGSAQYQAQDIAARDAQSRQIVAHDLTCAVTIMGLPLCEPGPQGQAQPQN